MDDAVDHPAIINPSNAASVRWKERPKPFKLLVCQPKSGAHSALPKFGSWNHILTVLGILLWVPALVPHFFIPSVSNALYLRPSSLKDIFFELFHSSCPKPYSFGNPAVAMMPDGFLYPSVFQKLA
jgi:hypothetical protein